jgi:hypothetical protein
MDELRRNRKLSNMPNSSKQQNPNMNNGKRKEQAIQVLTWGVSSRTSDIVNTSQS